MITRLALLLSASLLLCQCDDGGVGAAKVARLRGEVTRLQDSTARATKEAEALEAQVATLRNERDQVVEDKAKANAELSKIQQDLEQAKKDFEAYKQAHKIN